MGKKADKRAGPQTKEAEARVPALQEKLKGTNPDHFKETEKDFKGRLELANVEKEQFTLKKQAKNKQETQATVDRLRTSIWVKEERKKGLEERFNRTQPLSFKYSLNFNV